MRYTLYLLLITMKSSKMKEVLAYEKRAIESIPDDHPHSQEILDLLNDQLKDDLQSYANSRSTSWTVWIRKTPDQGRSW